MSAASPLEGIGRPHSADEIITLLSHPLDKARVKQRKGSEGKPVPYIPGYTAIETANQIFNYRWSFHLMGTPQVMVWEQVVTYWDKAKKERIPVVDAESGQIVTRRAGIVYVSGWAEITLDSEKVVHSDVGRVTFTGDTPEAIDTAMAGAATDCLKRCLRQFGDPFGNQLYDKRVAGNMVQRNGNGNGNGNGHRPPATQVKLPQNAAEAKAIACPIGTPDHPELLAMTLGQVAEIEIGPKVLEYLVSEKYQAEDQAGQQAKAGAKLLLAELPVAA